MGVIRLKNPIFDCGRCIAMVCAHLLLLYVWLKRGMQPVGLTQFVILHIAMAFHISIFSSTVYMNGLGKKTKIKPVGISTSAFKKLWCESDPTHFISSQIGYNTTCCFKRQTHGRKLSHTSTHIQTSTQQVQVGYGFSFDVVFNSLFSLHPTLLCVFPCSSDFIGL